MKLANGTYIRPTARFSWWMRKKTYLSYMLRELSSLFIGAFSLMMVWGVYQLFQGEAAYTAWSRILWGDFQLLSVTTFIFSVYHSVTWFMVTPKAMPLKISGKRVAGWTIIAAHLVLWLLCSIAIWYLVVNGDNL